jgi:hypothetical protein
VPLSRLLLGHRSERVDLVVHELEFKNVQIGPIQGRAVKGGVTVPFESSGRVGIRSVGAGRAKAWELKGYGPLLRVAIVGLALLQGIHGVEERVELFGIEQVGERGGAEEGRWWEADDVACVLWSGRNRWTTRSNYPDRAEALQSPGSARTRERREKGTYLGRLADD